MPYKTQLNGLRPLYKDMRSNKRSHEHFQVNYAHRVFDCIFYIDTTPFELLIGLVGAQWGTVVSVEGGFYASMSDSAFYDLCKLLELRPGRETFTSALFLIHIANNSPKHISANPIPPHILVDIDPRKRRQVDEADKIYFKCWMPQGNNQARNFQKTEVLIGKTAADFCRKHNISSCWTDDPDKARPVVMPWE